MTRTEFVQEMAYLTAGCGKQLPDASLEVYWDLLGDLPMEAFRAAARQVILSHPWATFPSIAELRQAALDAQIGHDAKITAQEAWAMAWRAAGKIDPDINGEYVTFKNGERITWPSMADYALDGLPPSVIVTMKTFGIHRLMAANEPIGVLQSQFCQTYTGLLTAAKREALLPAKLREQIASIGQMKKIGDCRE